MEKVFIIQSNHGNHEGFNRKWTVIDFHYGLEGAKNRLRELALSIDECITEEDGTIISPNDSLILPPDGTSFRYDGRKTHIITKSDYENGFFDGHGNGYVPKEIREEYEENEA